MRLLVFHVDRFVSTVTERGRSPLVEPVTKPTVSVENGLLVLASVERADESREAEVAAMAADEVARLARQLKVRDIVLNPFAHLFGEPAAPAAAVRALDLVVDHLRTAGLHVERVPFGWFTRWSLEAKGHPLSRVARLVRASEATVEGGEA